MHINDAIAHIHSFGTTQASFTNFLTSLQTELYDPSSTTKWDRLLVLFCMVDPIQGQSYLPQFKRQIADLCEIHGPIFDQVQRFGSEFIYLHREYISLRPEWVTMFQPVIQLGFKNHAHILTHAQTYLQPRPSDANSFPPHQRILQTLELCELNSPDFPYNLESEEQYTKLVNDIFRVYERDITDLVNLLAHKPYGRQFSNMSALKFKRRFSKDRS